MESGNSGGNVCGYDVEPVTDVNNDFFCMICLRIMRDPVQFSCGHGMCNGCYETLINNANNTECPQCRRSISRSQTVPAHMVKRVILALKVKCNNEQCPWIGELGDFEKHKFSCKYEMIPCTNNTCGETFERHRLKEHLNNCTNKPNKMIESVLKKLEEQQKEIDLLRNTVRLQEGEIFALKLQHATNISYPSSSTTGIPPGLVERVAAMERLNPISGGFTWLLPDLREAFANERPGVSSEEFSTCLHGYICRVIITPDSRGRGLDVRFVVLRRGSGAQRHFNYTVTFTACSSYEVMDCSFDAKTFRNGQNEVLWYRDLPGFISASKFKKIMVDGYLKVVVNFACMEAKSV